ncbi:MAG: sortase [Thermomicrobiales bacterium]
MTRRIQHWTFPFVVTLLVVFGMGAGVAANSGGMPDWESSQPGELKAGPLGLNAPASDAEKPVAMVIADAEVDADVEVRTTQDGVMQDPTGPWVVSWYDFSANVGSAGNSVYAGHVDYWDVGPAVLRNVADLEAGAEISVVGESGMLYTYAVEEVYRVNVYELNADDLDAIIGETDYAALTIITCGGEFDGSQYLQRDVVRAKLVNTQTAEEAEANAVPDETTSGSTGTLEVGSTATITNDIVNIRAEPTTAGSIVVTVNTGDVVTITGESQSADGYVWWPVETADGSIGWVAEDFLQP